MRCKIIAAPCPSGAILPLRIYDGRDTAYLKSHFLAQPNSQTYPQLGLRTGDALYFCKKKMFVVAGFASVPALSSFETLKNLDAFPVILKQEINPLLLACEKITDARAEYELTLEKNGWSLAVITLSDKGSAGERADTAGPLILEMLKKELKISLSRYYLLPDDETLLKSSLADLAWLQKIDLIITTGGTGLSIRDVTPQATDKILDLNLPGFEQAMMNASLSKTPKGALSRARAGIAGESLIINLPGSPKAVRENLEAVLPALQHGLAKLHGDSEDCGNSHE